jgi:hypothetical protein
MSSFSFIQKDLGNPLGFAETSNEFNISEVKDMKGMEKRRVVSIMENRTREVYVFFVY